MKRTFGFKGTFLVLLLASGILAGGAGIAGYGIADQRLARAPEANEVTPDKGMRSKKAVPRRSATAPPSSPPEAPAEVGKNPLADKPAVPRDRFGDALPEGALARLGTVRLRQGWLVSRVLFSPDGKQLALAGCGRAIGLWDVASGRERHQFHKEDTQPDGIAFSPDGALLAEGHRSVRLWDTKTGALRRQLPAAQAAQRAVVFTPDGNLVISGGHDKLIHLWDAHSGESLGKLKGHTSSVLTLAVTKDGSTLASAGSDRTIRLWDLATGKQIREIRGADNKDNYFNEGAFSPDGRWLVSAEAEGNAPARVWDARTGKERFQLGQESPHAVTVAFSPDGRLIASGHLGGALRLWDSATGKKVREWNCNLGLHSVAFSPNGKLLATASSYDSGPRLWDVATGTEVGESDSHRGRIQQICLTLDGKSLVSLGGDKQLLEWDLATGTPRRLLELPVGTRWNDYYHRLSPDGRVLAKSSRPDRTVTIFDLRTCKPLRAPLPLQEEPYFLCFAPDGRTLAIGCQQGGFYLWSWRDDARPRRIETPEKDMIFIHFFLPDSKQVVTGSMNRKNLFLHLWDVATGRRLFSFPANDQSPICTVSPDGRCAVGAPYAGRSIYVVDAAHRKVVRILAVAQTVNGLAFSPDGKFLAFGENESAGGTIALIDFATGERVALFKGHHSGVGTLLFSPDGRSLFSGAGDSTILHWDATGRLGKRPFHANLLAAWEALAGDPLGAYAARWDFLDAPKQSLRLLRERLTVAPAPADQVAKLVADLDSERFTTRQKAAQALEALGEAAEGAVRRILAGNATLEVQRRLEQFVQSRDREVPRKLRAIDVLEQVGTDEARQVLQALAKRAPSPRVVQAAAATLQRLAK